MKFNLFVLRFFKVQVNYLIWENFIALFNFPRTKIMLTSSYCTMFTLENILKGCLDEAIQGMVGVGGMAGPVGVQVSQAGHSVHRFKLRNRTLYRLSAWLTGWLSCPHIALAHFHNATDPIQRLPSVPGLLINFFFYYWDFVIGINMNGEQLWTCLD